ncbi:protein NEDD1-like [Liolophura sinensis]|uniref:protein NEDD1-like n=1 Tax=Liolophura sinensis TaxID=3198878 RepID=UPI003158F56F
MAEVRLVSVGDDIKLWDTGYVLYKQTNPHAHNVSSIAWNHDRSILASTSQNNDKIALMFVNNLSVNPPQIPIENKAGGLCVAFNTNSRYLLVGRSDHAIAIYDCKKKLYKKTYMDHKGPVTSVQFNWNDTYIASGSDSGEIILHSVVTGQSCSPLVAPNSQAVRQVQYSYYEKSILASASDDGSISLWDASARRLLHSFNQGHHAPASGVAFSPLNALLLCSVGLDKRILLCDTRGRKIMNTITTESPLTSIDMKNDGSTVAVGSTRGKIYVYDIRQGKTPVKLLSAHRSSVQAIKFRNIPEDSTTSQLTVKMTEKKQCFSPSQSSQRRHLPVSPAPHSDHTHSPGPSRRSDTIDGEAMEGVFSPLHVREGHSSKEESGLDNASGNISSGLEGVGVGLFSPLNDNNSLKVGRRGAETTYTTSPLVGNMHTSVNTSRGGSFTLPEYQATAREPVTLDAERGSVMLEASPLISHPSSLISHPSSLHSHGPQRSGLGSKSSSAFVSPRGPDISASPSLPITERMQIDKEDEYQRQTSDALLPRNIDFDEKHPTAPSQVNGVRSHPAVEGGASFSQTHNHGHTSQWHQSARGDNSDTPLLQQAQTFQEQMFRNMVKEAVEDVHDSLRAELLSVHVEMIRQFQIQLEEMNAMMSHYCGNAELVAEVKRLRAENERLKRRI